MNTKTTVQIPEVISSRIEFKRKFSFWEMIRAFVFLPKALATLIENRRSKLVDQKLLRRLQLTVTEVSGCAACSYQHAKMALREGMSNEEIVSFLSGGDDFIKPNEAKAIMFAQHFAESRGYPKQYAYDVIVQEYGDKQAGTILSSVQLMIAGNMVGIPYSAFQSRLKGKPFKDSSLTYELGMLISGILCLPVALVIGILRSLVGMPNVRCDKSAADD